MTYTNVRTMYIVFDSNIINRLNHAGNNTYALR
jgi:hypothetical protein